VSLSLLCSKSNGSIKVRVRSFNKAGEDAVLWVSLSLLCSKFKVYMSPIK